MKNYLTGILLTALSLSTYDSTAQSNAKKSYDLENTIQTLKTVSSPEKIKQSPGVRYVYSFPEPIFIKGEIYGRANISYSDFEKKEKRITITLINLEKSKLMLLVDGYESQYYKGNLDGIPEKGANLENITFRQKINLLANSGTIYLEDLFGDKFGNINQQEKEHFYETINLFLEKTSVLADKKTLKK